MRIFGLVALLTMAPAFAQEAETPRDPDNYAPWLGEQPIRSGDRWARVLLDLDERGRVLACRITESNIRNRNSRFWICHSFRTSFETAPVMRDGVAVRGTIERRIVMPGRNSRGAYERARREHREKQQRQQQGSSD